MYKKEKKIILGGIAENEKTPTATQVTVAWSVRLSICVYVYMSSVTLLRPAKSVGRNEMPFGLMCPLNMSDLQSMDFVVNRFFMKLFNTNVIDTVKLCRDYLVFDVPSVVIDEQTKIFLARFEIVEKSLR